MNEKLIKSMLKCDGTMGNCKGCIFDGSPVCRNDMTHHGGALIQLQEVVVENQQHMMQAMKLEIAGMREKMKRMGEELEVVDGALGRLGAELKAARHCDSCLYKGMDEARDVCEGCKAHEESHWVLAKRFVEPDPEPVEEPEEDDDGDVIEIE